MAQLLFLYGTLMKHVARGDAARLVAALGEGRPATTRGALYAVREGGTVYPALVLRGLARVKGMLHDLPADPAWLAALDQFENFDSLHPQASEYLRQRIPLRLETGGTAQAHAYIYQPPARPRLVRIGHGDFARYLREMGRRPFGA